MSNKTNINSDQDGDKIVFKTSICPTNLNNAKWNITFTNNLGELDHPDNVELPDVEKLADELDQKIKDKWDESNFYCKNKLNPSNHIKKWFDVISEMKSTESLNDSKEIDQMMREAMLDVYYAKSKKNQLSLFEEDGVDEVPKLVPQEKANVLDSYIMLPRGVELIAGTINADDIVENKFVIDNDNPIKTVSTALGNSHSRKLVINDVEANKEYDGEHALFLLKETLKQASRMNTEQVEAVEYTVDMLEALFKYID